MWLMYALPNPAGESPSYLVVDHLGHLLWIGRSLHDIVYALVSVGRNRIAVPGKNGDRTFRLETGGRNKCSCLDRSFKAALLSAPAGKGKLGSTHDEIISEIQRECGARYEVAERKRWDAIKVRPPRTVTRSTPATAGASLAASAKPAA